MRADLRPVDHSVEDGGPLCGGDVGIFAPMGHQPQEPFEISALAQRDHRYGPGRSALEFQRIVLV